MKVKYSLCNWLATAAGLFNPALMKKLVKLAHIELHAPAALRLLAHTSQVKAHSGIITLYWSAYVTAVHADP